MLGAVVRSFRGLLGRSGSPIEAAGSGRRWNGFAPMVAPREQIAASRALVMARARALVQNNALAASGAEAWVSALIGAGIVAKSTHASERVRRRIDAAWSAWTRDADADGRLGFEGLQALIARRVVVDGEALVLLTTTRNGALRLRVLPSESLADISKQFAGGYIANGVEFDASGSRAGYWLYTTPPGAIPNISPVRVDARDVLHVFRLDYPGQIRGQSWFAPVLLALAEAGKLSDALVLQQQTAAMLTGFVTTPEGDASGVFAGARDGEAVIPSLEPGSMVALNPGESVEFTQPPRTSGGEAVKRSVVREIAAGLGVPFEQLTGDLSSVNYSSIRAGLVEFRRKTEALQYALMGHQFISPVFGRFVTTAALGGRLYAPGELSPYASCEVYPPKTAWVDPKADAMAEWVAINAGLMSRTEALAARGWSAEEVDARIAADKAREKALGLSFNAPVAQAGGAV